VSKRKDKEKNLEKAREETHHIPGLNKISSSVSSEERDCGVT
jgi:hypothetical protein